jgi:hypothetical protein
MGGYDELGCGLELEINAHRIWLGKRVGKWYLEDREDEKITVCVCVCVCVCKGWARIRPLHRDLQ